MFEEGFSLFEYFGVVVVKVLIVVVFQQTSSAKFGFRFFLKPIKS